MPRRLLRHLLPACALVALVLAAYANVYPGDFVFDDLRHIPGNRLLRDLGAFVWGGQGLRAYPTRFVGYLSFALNVRLGGLGPQGFHAVNVAVHAAASLTVYALLVLAFRAPRLRASALAHSARALAFVTAALFATHPLQTQAVSYLVQRLTSLCALLYLAALALYLAWRLAGEAGKGRGLRRGLYAAALLAALLATRTKEIAVTLPLALVLVEVALFERPRGRALLAVLPFAALAALIPLALVAGGRPATELLSDIDKATRLQTPMGRLDYLRTQLDVVARYLGLLAWPAGQSIEHEVPVARSLLEPRVARGLALHLGLLALAALLWRRSAPGAARPVDPAARLAAAGIAFFYLALSVESSVVPIIDPMFEHRVYLPSAGIFTAAVVLAALGLRRLAGALPVRAFVGAGVALALVLGFATLLRNRVWFSEVALWSDAARKAPGLARPHLNLGTALAERGKFAAAVVPLRRAAEAAPQWAWPRSQLGAVLLGLGRGDEAERELRAALAIDGGDPAALFNLARHLAATGRPAEAREAYQRLHDTAPPEFAAWRAAAAAYLAR